MASLRRKPPPADVTAPDPVALSIDTEPPAPSPAPHQLDGAESALKAQLAALRQSEHVAAAQQQQQAAIAAAEQRRQSWLSQNELARENFAALSGLHNDALAAGYVDTSPEYFSYMTDRLADLQAQHPAAAAAHLVEEMRTRIPQEPPEPPRREPASQGRHVSAPVSRDGGTYGASGYSSSRIVLTRDQAEIARRSGITEAEYAKQLMKLREMQASGEYSERR